MALIEKPAVIKRILAHLHLWPTDDISRAPPSPAAFSGRSPSEPQVEPLLDDLPREESAFEDAQFTEDGEPTFETDGASNADDVSADPMDSDSA